MQINIEDPGFHTELDCLAVGDTFKLPRAKEKETRYMVVEHLRTINKDPSNVHYVCINTGVIYKTPRNTQKDVICMEMEANDVN